MARHRSDAAPDVSLPRPRSGRPHRYLDPDRAEYSQELPVAPRHSRRRSSPDAASTVDAVNDAGAVSAVSAVDAVPSPRDGGSRPEDPETTPLDLAAIALAATRAPDTRASDNRGPGTGGLDTRGADTGGLDTRGPGTGGHRLLSPSRTVGALAVLGAVAGAGVAAASGGSMLTAEPASASTSVEISTAETPSGR